MELCRSENEYIEKIAPAVQKACKKYGYLPSVLIAQSCLENGFGCLSHFDNDGIKDLLKHNNMVGLKKDLLNSTWADKSVWPGKWFTKETPEEYGGKKVTIKDDFRIYDNIQQSFEDFILFLLYASNDGKRPKYGPEVVNIKDPATLIEAVRSRGYATDSQYSKSVMNIVNRHNLTKYDGGNMKTDIDIIDITNENTPTRWGNTREALVFHFLGVAGADNPYLYDGGYGGHWYISRKGEVYHAVKPGGTVWAVGSGGWGVKTDKWNNGNTESVEMGCENDNGSDDIDDKTWWFHTKTQEMAVKLARYWLEERGYGVSESSVNERILMHNSITNKPCPAPWLHCAGYQSPRESGQRNWSFEEFKRKIWEGYGKDYLEKGDSGSSVKSMQNMLISLGYSCGSTGADGDFGNATYKAVKSFQKAFNIKATGIYDKETKNALRREYKQRVKGMKANEISVSQLLKSCKNVMDTARKNGYKYGDSRSLPPTDDGLISCDRLIAKALWDLGCRDQQQGGEVVSTLEDYLTKHGFKKSTAKKDIKQGSILLVTHKGAKHYGHAFVCVSCYDDWTTDRYDSGSDSRIQKKQPLKGISWEYQKENFAVFNIPEKKDDKKDTFKATGTATATVDDLNVRKEPDATATVLRKLNKGNRFEVDGQISGNWVHVRVAETCIGWIKKWYVNYD